MSSDRNIAGPTEVVCTYRQRYLAVLAPASLKRLHNVFRQDPLEAILVIFGPRALVFFLV